MLTIFSEYFHRGHYLHLLLGTRLIWLIWFKNRCLPLLVNIIEFLIKIHTLRFCKIQFFRIRIHDGFDMWKKLWWIFFIRDLMVIDHLDFTKDHVYLGNAEVVATWLLYFMEFQVPKTPVLRIIHWIARQFWHKMSTSSNLAYLEVLFTILAKLWFID